MDEGRLGRVIVTLEKRIREIRPRWVPPASVLASLVLFATVTPIRGSYAVLPDDVVGLVPPTPLPTVHAPLPPEAPFDADAVELVREPAVATIRGRASYYGRRFAGRLTASGERFDPTELTAAHRTLPFGTRLRVTNAQNGRSVEVRVNDRGPYHRGRNLDLSYASARAIGMVGAGVASVRIEVLD
jgi:rare lipoprotein A (peptidoglycan hydrolase)